MSDDHAKLGRDHVQPLRRLLADHMHGRPAARVGPIRPTRGHIAISPHGGLYAMPSLLRERLARRPASGSGLSLHIPF